ncbi:MAG: DJ-1/PfpI family protein, partial [Haloglomus sp.]
ANAGRMGGDCEVTLVTRAGKPHVRAGHGLRVAVDGQLGETDPDLVVVPGGGWNDRDSPGAWTEVQSGLLPAALADLHEEGVRLASVCTGGMLLAEAGLLDGRPAVTHHTATSDLREVADVRDARVVDAGTVVTAGGITSGLDLAFYLVRESFGTEVAER